MKDKDVIITIGEDDDALVNDPEWRKASAASEDAARAIHEGASDIERERLRRVEASYAERLVSRLKDVASRVASVARRVRAARSVRATRKAKAAAKAPTSDDGEPPAAIVEDLVYADDLEPFVRIMGRLIATSILS